MRKKRRYSALVGMIGVGLCCLASSAGAESRSAANSFGIIPMPFSVEAKKESAFKINRDTLIVHQGPESKPCADYLRGRIAAATGLKLAVSDSGGTNAIVLRVAADGVEFVETDAYTLESSSEKIIITGKGASGLFYGVQTLFQLLPAGIYSDTPSADMDLTVDALTIKDKPSMAKIRGLLVDVSRHFRGTQELKKIVDSMAMHKLNTLHLHLTDVEGWRVEIKSYPKLTTVGATGNISDSAAPAAFLTQEEVKEICAYAAERHVAIIPEIDMPGHMGAAIKAYPELKHLKDERDPAKVIRGDNMARDFCKKVLREISELFDAEYIHIGCDEVNHGSKVELYSKSELVEFAREMSAFIKTELKKTPVVWDDVFIQGFHDKDVVVQWWRYGKEFWWKSLKYTVDEELSLRQQPFMLSPGYWTYFDMLNVKPEKGSGGWAQAISTAEVYNWDPFGDMRGVTAETRKLAVGAIACTWSEKIPTMKVFGDRTYPRLAAFSERVWSGGKSENASLLSWDDYRDKVLIPYQLKRYDALGLWYWSKDSPGLLKTLGDARKTLR